MDLKSNLLKKPTLFDAISNNSLTDSLKWKGQGKHGKIISLNWDLFACVFVSNKNDKTGKFLCNLMKTSVSVEKSFICKQNPSCRGLAASAQITDRRVSACSRWTLKDYNDRTIKSNQREIISKIYAHTEPRKTKGREQSSSSTCAMAGDVKRVRARALDNFNYNWYWFMTMFQLVYIFLPALSDTSNLVRRASMIKSTTKNASAENDPKAQQQRVNVSCARLKCDYSISHLARETSSLSAAHSFTAREWDSHSISWLWAQDNQ